MGREERLVHVTLLTVEGREDYLRQTIESWYAAAAATAAGFSPGFNTLRDTEHWGIDLAGRAAIETALEYAEFGIVAFDDCLVSRDILDYFRWASEEFRDDPHVASVGGWRPGGYDLTPDTYYEVQEDHWFRAGVWGTWRHKWETMLAPTYPKENADIWYTDTLYPQNGWVEVRPTWSRVQTIGAYGVHMRPEMLEAHTARPWAGDLDAPRSFPNWHMKGEAKWNVTPE